MKTSELKISLSVESYDEKTVENDRFYYVVEKHKIILRAFLAEVFCN